MKFSENAIKQMKALDSDNALTKAYLNDLAEALNDGNSFDKVADDSGRRIWCGYSGEYADLIVSAMNDTITGIGYLYEVNNPKYLPEYGLVFGHGSDYSAIWKADTMECIATSGDYYEGDDEDEEEEWDEDDCGEDED